MTNIKKKLVLVVNLAVLSPYAILHELYRWHLIIRSNTYQVEYILCIRKDLA